MKVGAATLALLALTACAGGPPPDVDPHDGFHLRGVQFRGAAPDPAFERAFRKALNALATDAPVAGAPVDLIITVESVDDAAFLGEQLLSQDSRAQIRVDLHDPATETRTPIGRLSDEDGAVTIIGAGLINPLAGIAATGFSILANALSNETEAMATDLAAAVRDKALIPNEIRLPRHTAFFLPPARNPDQRRPGSEGGLWLGRHRTETAARKAISDVLRFDPDVAAVGWFEVTYEERRYVVTLNGLSPERERALCARRRANDEICVLAP